MTRQEFEKMLPRQSYAMLYGIATGRPDWGEGFGRLVPAHLQGGMLRWLVLGTEPGGFMRALLTNDLMRVYDRADELSRAAIGDLTVFLYNYAPSGSWGSSENFKSWVGILPEQH